MVLLMDRAGEGVVACWENEAHFGTLCARVHGAMQPGQSDVFYPAQLGKVWKNAGTEVLSMERLEAPLSLTFYFKKFDLWEHFAKALQPDLVTMSAELRAAALAFVVAKVVVKPWSP